jgi:hypothetical protein
MNINVNRINCCTIGDYFYHFDKSISKWKEEHQDCIIVHMMQTQSDKFIICTIWYKEYEQ